MEKIKLCELYFDSNPDSQNRNILNGVLSPTVSFRVRMLDSFDKEGMPSWAFNLAFFSNGKWVEEILLSELKPEPSQENKPASWKGGVMLNPFVSNYFLMEGNTEETEPSYFLYLVREKK